MGYSQCLYRSVQYIILSDVGRRLGSSPRQLKAGPGLLSPAHCNQRLKSWQYEDHCGGHLRPSRRAGRSVARREAE